jgi:hypothetical protein
MLVQVMTGALGRQTSWVSWLASMRRKQHLIQNQGKTKIEGKEALSNGTLFSYPN